MNSTLTVVAALLTIVGFSVNDTVVICDRIRENLRKIKRETLESIINTSINETLSRTILTTSTALIGARIVLFFRRRSHQTVRLRAVGRVYLRRVFDDFYR